MSYHYQGRATQGLGATYSANDPLSKEIIARQGDTSEASLAAYGKTAGTMGGAGVCVAFGAAAAAPACGIIGGLVIGWIASQIPVAKGSTITDAVVDLWKTWQGPNLKWSQRAMLGVKAYYVMRDAAIDQAIVQGATAAWAEEYLNKYGITREPSPGRWAPKAERYNHTIACTGDTWKEWSAAKDVGIPLDCLTYVQLTYGPWPPVANKGDKVDWGLIAWDEIVSARNYKGKGWTCAQPAFGGKTVPITCPSAMPSQWARDKIIKLKPVAAKMLTDAKSPNRSAILALVRATSPLSPASSPLSPVTKTVVVAGAAGLLWWVGKKFLF